MDGWSEEQDIADAVKTEAKILVRPNSVILADDRVEECPDIASLTEPQKLNLCNRGIYLIKRGVINESVISNVQAFRSLPTMNRVMQPMDSFQLKYPASVVKHRAGDIVGLQNLLPHFNQKP